MVRFLPLLIVPVLAACGDAAPPAGLPIRDPAIAAALAEPLLTDPELRGASQAGATLRGGGLADGGVPLIKPTDDELAAARVAAQQALGSKIAPAPPPFNETGDSPLARSVTAEAVAKALPFARACAAGLSYSFAWAAKLPPTLPVYPRAAAQEAGGNDQYGCKLRVVNFQTQVPAGEVIDFYYAAASKAGLAPRHALHGGDSVVSGGKGSLRFAVHVRQLADGMTEADLVTNG